VSAAEVQGECDCLLHAILAFRGAAAFRLFGEAALTHAF